MHFKRLAVATCVFLSAAAGSALTPASEVFLAAVGRGQGSCPGGVCAQWRTSAWVTNVSATQTATVQIAFLVRGQANPTPQTATVSLAPGESREFADIFADPLGLDGVFGALRFRSNVAIAVNGRSFDANVQTSKGTGSAGQDVPGIPLEGAIVAGQSTVLSGLAQDGAGLLRSNFGFVEAMGRSCTVEAALLAADSTVLATKIYQVLPFEPFQPPITDIGAPLGVNQRVRLKVTAGDGAIIAIASRIDNHTGDPTTVDMTHAALIPPAAFAGTWSGPWVNTTFGSTGTTTVVVTVDVDARSVQMRVTLTGTVFGGSPPPPEMYTGLLSPLGFTLNTVSAFMGPLNVNIYPNGLITGQATPDPSSGIAKLTFWGYTNGTQMQIAYFITFTAGRGGGQAGGYCTLTKA